MPITPEAAGSAFLIWVLDRSFLQMQEVRRPIVEPIKDVRRIDDSGAADIALLTKELQQRLTHDRITQIHGARNLRTPETA